jgi:hypothetical protein
VRKLVALYRQASYSPNQHRTNDTAILDATVAELEAHGWSVVRANEASFELDQLADADLVLNMCQGPVASERLLALEQSGLPIINPPSSVLGCHRHRMVTILGDRIPRTAIVPTSGDPELDGFGADGRRVWIKRGDVHAERAEDVVSLRREEIPDALRAFAARGIARVAMQEHIAGPIVKFYGLSDGRFFKYYDAEHVDEERLKALAFAAAERLGLVVFGGDVACPEPDRPVLIDLNDWPSFAPYRAEAARHIAGYVTDNFSRIHSK